MISSNIKTLSKWSFLIYLLLIVSCTSSKNEAIKILTSKGYSVDGAGIVSAFRAKDKVAISQFIKAEIDPNTIIPAYKLPLLAVAIAENNDELFNYLIENGADLNFKIGKYENPVLHAAIVEGNLKYIEELVKHGADMAATNVVETNAFGAALGSSKLSEEQNIEVLKLLVKLGARPDMSDKMYSSTKDGFKITGKRNLTPQQETQLLIEIGVAKKENRKKITAYLESLSWSI